MPLQSCADAAVPGAKDGSLSIIDGPVTWRGEDIPPTGLRCAGEPWGRSDCPHASADVFCARTRCRGCRGVRRRAGPWWADGRRKASSKGAGRWPWRGGLCVGAVADLSYTSATGGTRRLCWSRGLFFPSLLIITYRISSRGGTVWRACTLHQGGAASVHERTCVRVCLWVCTCVCEQELLRDASSGLLALSKQETYLHARLTASSAPCSYSCVAADCCRVALDRTRCRLAQLTSRHVVGRWPHGRSIRSSIRRSIRSRRCARAGRGQRAWW